MFLKNVEGSYIPSFFLIQIDADEDVASILAKQEGTFVHEYIHLLQDLILPYCIRENLIKLKEFFLTTDKFRQDGRVMLPVNITDDDLQLTARQTAMSWGGAEFIDDVNKISSLESSFEIFQGDLGEFRVYMYVLTTDDGSPYHIGARDFLEYIAYKIEKKQFPETEELPDLPYRSIDLLFDYLGLSSVSEDVKVCVAEYCLLNDNPMRRFMVLMDDLKTQNVAILDDKEKCRELLINLPWVARGKPPESIAEKIERKLGQLREHLKYRYPEEALPNVHAWIESVVDYARNELAGKLLFSHLYGLDNASFKAALTEILQKVGIPMILNSKHQLGTSLGDEVGNNEFIQLLMAYEFSSYAKGDYLTCPVWRCLRGRRAEYYD